MLPVSRTIFPHSYLCYFFMIALNLPIPSINAADHEDVRRTPLPTANDAISEAQTLILGTTLTETFSFEDVYRIELSLNVSGNIELIATEENVITVTLEKQAHATHPKLNDLVRDYLDNITFTGTQADDTLQLAIQLPDNSPEAEPNSLANTGTLLATHYDRLQLKCTIKTPADVSAKLHAKAGDIHLQGIRGKIETSIETGNVHLGETLGNYNINVIKGNIDGKILLTHGKIS